ncbi:MAG: hypothetical protein HC893_02515 [Chloroflexaceae bacterium]|nr:hypothetical protein [Chloroflexaceae bacterium]NJL32916.1 hypothetical protein [Chloroflexaceae bacterium]NJO04488.1 hypothetical protein [Chloroflexaceae bacterium]
MSEPTTQSPPLASLTVADLEKLIRRVVREEVARLQARQPSLLNDWSQEGPDDPAGDAALLAEILAEIEREQTEPLEWMRLEDFKIELRREGLLP